MKPFFSLFVALTLVTGAIAQTKTTKKPVAKPAATLMKTQTDSVCYALGMSLANFYREQGMKTINAGLVNKAINDVIKNGKTLLTEEQMNMSISNYLQQLKAEKAAGNKKAGEAFLAANKTKPGVVTTASGLQYMIIKEGSGAKPTINDKVRCHYTGTLIDGTVFDSSVERGQPAEFPLNGVIRGWTEALQLMPVGSRWKLFLPSELAYGDNQAGPKIGPGSTLVFDVELLDIVK
jgi:FKBP-type peptidyl-prolyl cis-trans isomerase FklB